MSIVGEDGADTVALAFLIGFTGFSWVFVATFESLWGARAAAVLTAATLYSLRQMTNVSVTLETGETEEQTVADGGELDVED